MTKPESIISSPTDQDRIRFFRKVIIDDDDCFNGTPCWYWTGCLNRSGYGTFGLASKCRLAHRVSYAWHVAQPSPDLVIDHLCRHRNCVNPAHLEEITRKENADRGDTLNAKYPKRTHCNHGHEFTPDNIIWRKAGDKKYRKCRTCHQAYDTARKSASRANDSAAYNQSMREWRNENPDHYKQYRREYMKNYRAKNKDEMNRKAREYSIKYRAENREKINAYAREYARKNRK